MRLRNFPGIFFQISRFFFFQKSVLNAEARKQASQQASKQGSKQVGKQASQPASKQASKQRKARKGRVYFLSLFFVFSSLASVAFVAFVGSAFVALPFFICLSIYLI